MSSRRPTTPKGSSSGQHGAPPHGAPPPIPSRNPSAPASHRRTSLNFLRRSKSGDPVRNRMPVVSPSAPRLPDIPLNGAPSSSGYPRHLMPREIRESADILSGKFAGNEGKFSPPKQQQQQHQHHQQTDSLNSFVPGRKSTDSTMGSDGGYVKTSTLPLTEDPYKNVGSMANRGRYSYASSAVSTVHPHTRRLRRRKDPTPFNILVLGAKGSGKTSFVRFLRRSLALAPRRGEMDTRDLVDLDSADTENPFKSSYLETEVDNERIGLTLWDSVGLEANIVDLQLRETVAFIERKFEETFVEETKVIRTPGTVDTHIHCAFLLLDPARLTPTDMAVAAKNGGLAKDLDLSVLRALQGKTMVVPVISKADTCTSKHMERLKGLVRLSLAKSGLDPLESMELDFDEEEDDEDEGAESVEGQTPTSLETDSATSPPSRAAPSPPVAPPLAATTHTFSPGLSFSPGISFLPLSVLSPDDYEPGEPVGRSFPWGFADPYDERHCDFARLKECVFGEWRAELREKSRDLWYEGWRSERLGSSGARGGGRRR